MVDQQQQQQNEEENEEEEEEGISHAAFDECVAGVNAHRIKAHKAVNEVCGFQKRKGANSDGASATEKTQKRRK